jgi:hypothetical protein
LLIPGNGCAWILSVGASSDDVLAPPGTSLRDFVALDPVKELSSNEKDYLNIIISDASVLARAFLPAFGIPVDFLSQNAEDVAKAFLRAHRFAPQRLPDKL